MFLESNRRKLVTICKNKRSTQKKDILAANADSDQEDEAEDQFEKEGDGTPDNRGTQ